MTRSAALDGPRSSGALRWPWAFAVATMLTIAGGAAWDRWHDRGAAALDPAALQPWFGPRSFAEAAMQADQKVAGARESLAVAPGEWVRGEELALALIGRWRLRGDYADLAEAERLLAAGMAGTSGAA